MKNLSILFALLYLVASTPSAVAQGEIEKFITGGKRPNKIKKKRDKMNAYAASRAGYHKNLEQRIDNLNGQREQLLLLIANTSKIKILADELSNKCAKEVQGMAEVERCLALLNSLISDVVDLRIALTHFSGHSDLELRQVALQPQKDAESLQARLYGVLEVWTDNKYKLITDKLEKDMNSAAEKGRVRAKCQVAPNREASKILRAEKIIAAAEFSGNLAKVYQAAATHMQIIEAASEIKNLCGANISDTSRVQQLGLKLTILLGSEKSRQWFAEKCARFSRENPGEIDCSTGITPALLFTLGGKP